MMMTTTVMMTSAVRAPGTGAVRANLPMVDPVVRAIIAPMAWRSMLRASASYSACMRAMLIVVRGGSIM